MRLRLVNQTEFLVGDLVRLKDMPGDEHFCIIGFKDSSQGEPLAILKALFNDTFIIEKPISRLTSLLVRGKL